MDFVSRHIDALIPFAAGMVFLADGLRRTFAGSNGRRWLQLGALLVLISIGYFTGAPRSGASVRQFWTPVSEVGQFSVMLPTQRTYSEFDDPTPLGPSRSHKWNAGADPNRRAYVFRYRDLPAGSEYQDPQSTLDAMVKALAGTAGTRINSIQPLSMAGFPGRQVDGAMNGMDLRGQFFLTRTRMYLLIRTSWKGVAPEDDPFFSSFNISAR